MGGEQQVYTEAAAALRDIDQRVDERGQLLGERRELVDDDHEAGDRRMRLAIGDRTVERGDVGCAGLAQHPFTSVHLGLETLHRARRACCVEISDHRDHVG